jgi:hypothetical protein
MFITLKKKSPGLEAIRVFPARTNWTPTDALAFVGNPPLPDFRPSDPNTPVLVSVTFTWHKQEGERLASAWSQYYSNVQLGGPAYNDTGDEFTPGMFLKRGCTITSRGCPKRCGWCVVPTREGGIRELEIKSGWIVQDNNLLACSDGHIRRVFEMLQSQNRKIFFNGGLDKHYLRDWHRPLFDSISVGELWFACDTMADVPALEKAAKILDGIPLRKRRCYTMIGYEGETLADAQRRIERVFELGFMPFCQLYQPDERKTYSLEWRNLKQKWSRVAAYMPRVSLDSPSDEMAEEKVQNENRLFGF